MLIERIQELSSEHLNEKFKRIRGYKLNKGGFKLKFWFRITSDATQYFLSTQWLRTLYLNREIFPV